jgi:hypothetical protein
MRYTILIEHVFLIGVTTGELQMSNGLGCQCGQAHIACTNEFQYAVKVLCGEVDVKTPGAPAAFGQYLTAVNLHNPEKCKTAIFRLKLTIANEGREGPISIYYPFRLRPDASMEIDCPLIRAIAQILYPPPQSVPNFIKGYLVIEGDALDVVAVYTAAAAAGKPIATFHTERVEGRCVPVCDDLVLPLHTGVAAWQTVSPAPLGPVVPVSNTGWTTLPPFGSQMVSQLAADGVNATPGTRSYQLCFDLCSGFDVPASFPIQVVVDDTATVYLNNQQIGGIVPWMQLTTITVTSQFLRQYLQAGNNCFRVDVTNKTFPPPPPPPNPTGFALAGILRVARGRCPCVPLPMVPTTTQGHSFTAAADTTLFDQIAAASKAE